MTQTACDAAAASQTANAAAAAAAEGREAHQEETFTCTEDAEC